MPQTNKRQETRVSPFNSIFVRCAILVAVTTIVVATVLSIGAKRQLDAMATADVQKQAASTIDQAVNALAKPIRFKVVPKIEEQVSRSLDIASENGLVAMVFDAEGTVLALAEHPGTEDIQTQLSALAFQAMAEGTAQQSDRGLLSAEPVLAGPEGPVIGIFAMAWTDEALRLAAWRSQLMLLALAGVTFAVLIGLTLWALHQMLGQPLKQLTEAVAGVADGDYDSKLDMVGRRDEIGGIARNLSALMAVLKSGRTAEDERGRKLREQVQVVEELGFALDVLAQGVLHHRVDDKIPEDYKMLRDHYNRALDNLHQVMGNVSLGSQRILSHADQIATASEDLAHRTESQAATLEKSAMELQDLLNSVRQAAEQAEQADRTVSSTHEIAERSGSVMKSAVAAMGEIEQSSVQISEIISVIDDIAFQTNLLALNAGVEAARAGESGKGFAVVAQEVRGLAQRSADAAKQIKSLIVNSGDQVKNGVQLVEAAGNALNDVLTKVAEMAGMVNNIATASHQQADGLKAIHNGVGSLDQVTQQNAAMAEEATATAQLLREDAKDLRTTVAVFAMDAQRSDSEGFGPEGHSHNKSSGFRAA